MKIKVLIGCLIGYSTAGAFIFPATYTGCSSTAPTTVSTCKGTSRALRIKLGAVADENAGRIGEGKNATGLPNRMPIKGLSAQKFQHPYDEEATRALRRLPGLEFGARSLTPVLEETIYLDNIANSVLVNEEQLPSIFALLVEACSILDMPTVPELYVRQNPVPNAYTLAINGKKPFMVLTSSLVDLMNREELQAVIAHELGHLKCEHGVWVTTANVIAQGLYRSGFGAGQLIAEGLGVRRRLMQWSRAAEFSCDRASLLVVQDLNVVVSTLLKLVGGSVSTAKELSVEAFLKQASTYEVASRSRLGRLLSNSQADELSHPLPVVRAKELEKWSRSLTYMKLVRRTDQLNRLQKN